MKQLKIFQKLLKGQNQFILYFPLKFRNEKLLDFIHRHSGSKILQMISRFTIFYSQLFIIWIMISKDCNCVCVCVCAQQFYYSTKRNTESFWHRHQKGVESAPPSLVFSRAHICFFQTHSKDYNIWRKNIAQCMGAQLRLTLRPHGL